VTYSEAQHWVHDDEPERFSSDVGAFLEADGNCSVPSDRSLD
jgi:hypothetical protein